MVVRRLVCFKPARFALLCVGPPPPRTTHARTANCCASLPSSLPWLHGIRSCGFRNSALDAAKIGQDYHGLMFSLKDVTDLYRHVNFDIWEIVVQFGIYVMNCLLLELLIRML